MSFRRFAKIEIYQSLLQLLLLLRCWKTLACYQLFSIRLILYHVKSVLALSAAPVEEYMSRQGVCSPSQTYYDKFARHFLVLQNRESFATNYLTTSLEALVQNMTLLYTCYPEIVFSVISFFRIYTHNALDSEVLTYSKCLQFYIITHHHQY